MAKYDFALPVLAERVEYYPDTGEFVWKYCAEQDARWNTRYAGQRAGALRGNYVRIKIKIDGKAIPVSAHRLAWFMVHKKVPDNEIDHINGVGDDNRVCNLRDVPSSLNSKNRALMRTSTSGIAGVNWHKRTGKWAARVCTNYARMHLGLFDSKEEAASAVASLRPSLQFTPRHGEPRT